MNVLVLGSGGREHALAWKLAQSPHVDRVVVAPGNGGIVMEFPCADLSLEDLDGLVAFARKYSIGFTVVGPEAPLVAGVVDRFRAEGLAILGPTRAAAQLEGSKAFAKEFMARHGIPTAAFRICDTPEAAREAVEAFGVPVVVKADGLAGGKGVVVAQSREEAHEAIHRIMVERAFGDAGRRVVVEECLQGEEASFMAFTDGTAVLPMASSQDHKRVFDGDRGPNTGGMGAYSPAPVITEALASRIMTEIMEPAVRGMAEEGRPFQGVLYAGLMITPEGPKVLEFNVRFGDPEAQPVLMRLEGDLMEVFQAMARQRLSGVTLSWKPRAAVCVVLASQGYPGSYEKGRIIQGLESVVSMGNVKVFHAGTGRDPEGRLVTAGGRVLGVTALGKTVAEARAWAYNAVRRIHFEGVHYRKDIAARAAAETKGGT